jgi:hypothetical protein
MLTTRQLWQLFEPVHAITYFSPESRAAADALGMRGFWMGYFAQRAAPLGQVGPAVVTACFHGFHPARVARALPEAWTYTTPSAALDARLAGVDATLRRLLPDVGTPAVAEAAALAGRAAAAADTQGRVLAAANQTLPLPDAPHLALWQACTTLREHRGDGHVAALVAHGLDPVRAHLLKAGAGEADGDVLRDGRRWPEEDWRDGAARLHAAGLTDDRGALTAAGRALHERVESATDSAAERPWQVLGERDTARLAELLTPLAAAVLDSGAMPVPNPVGLLPAS